MTMRDMHGLGCLQCKIRKQFYERFNSDSNKDVSYFGIISYIKLYMPYLSEEKLPEKKTIFQSNICLRLFNQWTIKTLTNKNSGLKSELSCKKSSKKLRLASGKNKLPTLKKSDSFSSESSSQDITVGSNNVGTTKNISKCKLTKKSPVRKVKAATKEPRIGTLKRKRWNFEKLKSNEAYEDDLFEERKIKRIGKVPDDPNSVDEKISTPRWSVQISPRELNRSPSYEDCYSPNELENNRKAAEEYRYRRSKRLSVRICQKMEKAAGVFKEDPDTYKTLKEVRNKLEKLEKKECESEEDYYFTDNAEDSE